MSLGGNWPELARLAAFTGATGLAQLALSVIELRDRFAEPSSVGPNLWVAGASNWIDRVLRGNVVGFLTVGIGPIRTGVFNVADVATWPERELWCSGPFAGTRR